MNSLRGAFWNRRTPCETLPATEPLGQWPWSGYRGSQVYRSSAGRRALHTPRGSALDTRPALGRACDPRGIAGPHHPHQGHSRQTRGARRGVSTAPLGACAAKARCVSRRARLRDRKRRRIVRGRYRCRLRRPPDPWRSGRAGGRKAAWRVRVRRGDGSFGFVESSGRRQLGADARCIPPLRHRLHHEPLLGLLAFDDPDMQTGPSLESSPDRWSRASVAT